MTGFLKSIETVAGQTIGLIRENGQVEDCSIVDPSELGGVPLSSVFYVDPATTTPPASQNGSEGAPWSTLLAAVTARAGLGGTFNLVPADYSAEVIPNLDGTNLWSFIGLDFGTFEVTSGGARPAGPATILPALTVDASSPNVALRSVKMGGSFTNNGAAGVFACDTNFNGLFGLAGSFGSVLRGQRCYFGSNGVGPFVFIDLDYCGFQGSQSLVSENSGGVKLTNCYGETSIVFQGAPAIALVDLYTREQLTVPVVTNGTKLIVGFGPPSALPSTNVNTPALTASLASPQAQIDDIVSTGVLLGLWTDNRVP